LVQKFLSFRIIEMKMSGYFFLAQFTSQMVESNGRRHTNIQTLDDSEHGDCKTDVSLFTPLQIKTSVFVAKSDGDGPIKGKSVKLDSISMGESRRH
jgi:hypothetical protein